jgi:hypothetical protein
MPKAIARTPLMKYGVDRCEKFLRWGAVRGMVESGCFVLQNAEEAFHTLRARRWWVHCGQIGLCINLVVVLETVRIESNAYFSELGDFCNALMNRTNYSWNRAGRPGIGAMRHISKSSYFRLEECVRSRRS